MAHGPLISDFIEKSDQVWLSDETGWAREHFDRERLARKALQLAYAKGNINIDNVEDLFDLYETASLLRRLSDLNTRDVERLPRDLRFVIMRTLERSITYPMMSPTQFVGAPLPYAAFVDLLQQMMADRRFAPVAIISFNYDLCLDYALALNGIEADYGFGSAAKSPGSKLLMLKLHGSLNWMAKRESQELDIKPVIALKALSYFHRLGVDYPVERPIDTMELLHGPDSWGERPIPDPIIVPPTWSKGKFYELLIPVWRRASAVLNSAENTFVVGYSLAPSDQFFRSFHALSTMAGSIVNRFWVFDPSDSVRERYMSLLGPAIKRQSRFRHELLNFSQAITFLADGLSLDAVRIDELQKSSRLGRT